MQKLAIMMRTHVVDESHQVSPHFLPVSIIQAEKSCCSPFLPGKTNTLFAVDKIKQLLIGRRHSWGCIQSFLSWRTPCRSVIIFQSHSRPIAAQALLYAYQVTIASRINAAASWSGSASRASSSLPNCSSCRLLFVVHPQLIQFKFARVEEEPQRPRWPQSLLLP